MVIDILMHAECERSSKFAHESPHLDMTLSNKGKTLGSISAQRERGGPLSRYRMFYQLGMDSQLHVTEKLYSSDFHKQNDPGLL